MTNDATDSIKKILRERTCDHTWISFKRQFMKAKTGWDKDVPMASVTVFECLKCGKSVYHK